MSVVNLNKVRKDKARRDRRAKADENAVKFGRTKAQKQSAAKETSKHARDLDGHKREP